MALLSFFFFQLKEKFHRLFFLDRQYAGFCRKRDANWSSRYGQKILYMDHATQIEATERRQPVCILPIHNDETAFN
ncbi:MAG TPA: hypothetical protein DCK93_16925 [Blastocatellia bacterium]|jgi:hypothetical protein|nr:hypothetical protein [Blastocatellia bacterium]